MKHSELRLDTIYADKDGRPLMVLSLDKVSIPRRDRGYGTSLIRDVGIGDSSFGVVILHHTRVTRSNDLDHLQETARAFQGVRPVREAMHSGYLIEVTTLRSIVQTWDDYLLQEQLNREREAEAAARASRARALRAGHISRIQALLPDGVAVNSMSEFSNTAQIRLDDLVDVLTAAAPVELDAGTSFTPREMSLLAAGFDAAVATLRYDDDTPVDIVGVVNPFRSKRSAS